MSNAKLEGLFTDELALLQPTPGYMRLVKDRVLYVWQQLTSEVKDRAAESKRRVKAIQQKLDRLDEAYLFAQTIDLTSYERQRDKLREERRRTTGPACLIPDSTLPIDSNTSSSVVRRRPPRSGATSCTSIFGRWFV